MPIYAYRCEACGFAKDALQKVSDAPLTICPSCNQPAFKKQVTAAGFQLKGSGWYVTDFRGGSGGAAAPGTPASTGNSTEKSESSGTAETSTAAPTPSTSTTSTSES